MRVNHITTRHAQMDKPPRFSIDFVPRDKGCHIMLVSLSRQAPARIKRSLSWISFRAFLGIFRPLPALKASTSTSSHVRNCASSDQSAEGFFDVLRAREKELRKPMWGNLRRPFRTLHPAKPFSQRASANGCKATDGTSMAELKSDRMPLSAARPRNCMRVRPNVRPCDSCGRRRRCCTRPSGGGRFCEAAATCSPRAQTATR